MIEPLGFAQVEVETNNIEATQKKLVTVQLCLSGRREEEEEEDISSNIRAECE